MEQEVDRIIDSQDNEYVLSRPKCAHTSCTCPLATVDCDIGQRVLCSHT